MQRLNRLHIYRRHLEDRYNKLIERSNDYKYVDKSKSDSAAFKALKVLEKLNRVKYLERDFSNSVL